MMETLMTFVAILIGVILFVKFGLGFVIISDTEIGVVSKKLGKALPNGKFIALNGEAGVQADTLAPGWHFFYWSFMYEVVKQPMISIKEGEIAVVLARDGSELTMGRNLCKVVDCEMFQDSRKFLTNGGEKGRQLSILTSGVYRINTMLFEVITNEQTDKISQHGLSESQLRVTTIQPENVGIVTVLDGKPLPEKRIAGPSIDGHSSFQDPQSFINNEGFKGLQEDVLRPGSYILNPWFVKIQQVPMIEVPLGHVGVVISSSGASEEDVSGTEFTHTNLVKQGNRGIWADPLFPGKHALNTQVLKVEMVPTTNVVLNWGHESSSHKYDEKLSSIKARTKDGFDMSVDVSQIIHIPAPSASKVISRVGSVLNLVENILEPIIGNYFRNASQNAEALHFVSSRQERQKEASEFIKEALKKYNIEAVETLIGDLVPPAELMETLKTRKIAEEQKQTYGIQKQSQDERKKLVEATALADAQAAVIKEEQEIKVAQSRASQMIKTAEGDAKRVELEADAKAKATKISADAESQQIRSIGDARASAYQASANAIGQSNLATIEIIGKIADGKVKITPDIYSSGSSEGAGGMQGLLFASLVDKITNDGKKPEKIEK